MVTRERRVVVGVSQSLAGLAALRYAVREARHRDAPLYAVRTWTLPSHWRGAAATVWQQELCVEACRYIVKAFDAGVGVAPDVNIVVAAPDGRPDQVLVETAGEEADLLVLGGRSGWRRRWPSWVVRGCLGAARCPVIVVPPPALARSNRWLSWRRLMHELDGLRSGSEGSGAAQGA